VALYSQPRLLELFYAVLYDFGQGDFKFMILASFNCRSENISVLPIVIAELKLGDIERHIFSAHFMERADHATLENRPEALDGLGMDYANDILALGMIDDAMPIFFPEFL
jgi:hypothetical protein